MIDWAMIRWAVFVLDGILALVYVILTVDAVWQARKMRREEHT